MTKIELQEMLLDDSFDKRVDYYFAHKKEILEFYNKNIKIIEKDFKDIENMWCLKMPLNVKFDYLTKCYLAMEICHIRHNKDFRVGIFIK